MIISVKNWLADIAIQQNNLGEAEKLLTTGLSVAEHNKNQRRVARYQRSFASLEKARGNYQKAYEWAAQAIRGFQRLGMKVDAEKLRFFLNDLDNNL